MSAGRASAEPRTATAQWCLRARLAVNVWEQQHCFAGIRTYWDLFPEDYFHVLQWRPQIWQRKCFWGYASHKSLTGFRQLPHLGRCWINYGLHHPPHDGWRAPQCLCHQPPAPAQAGEQRRCSPHQNNSAGSTGSQLEGGRWRCSQITWDKGSWPEELPVHQQASYKPVVLNKQNPWEWFLLLHILHCWRRNSVPLGKAGCKVQCDTNGLFRKLRQKVLLIHYSTDRAGDRNGREEKWLFLPSLHLFLLLFPFLCLGLWLESPNPRGDKTPDQDGKATCRL